MLTEKEKEKILKKAKMQKLENEWYNLRPILGHANWAIFYILLGGREIGKSYSVTNFFVDQFVKKGIPFIWMRLTESQSDKLLNNNAEKLIDPDLRRKYNLDLKTIGNNVYHVEYGERQVKKRDGTIAMKRTIVKKTLMARVFNLSTFYSDKGSIFDKDFLNDLNMRYNIAIDEFQREKNERKNFDILYALVNQLENVVRSTKERIKIFMMGNTLEEASDILCAFNFIPEKWGVFKIKKKRAVIHNIPPSNAYLKRRSGTIADILMPDSSTFTNKLDSDKSLICKKRLTTPFYVVKFDRSKDTWFTIWDGNVIRRYTNESKPVITMKPYLFDQYDPQKKKMIIELFDQRCFRFVDLITFRQFQKEMILISPKR